MSRPIWKGVVSFGLVSVPVTLYSGQESTDLQFNLIDSRNNAKVRYERVNEVTGDEVPWDSIVKGYEYGDDNYVLLNDEDFRQVAVAASKTIEIEDFIDETEINSVYFEKPYYLVPAKGGDKGYALLREAMKQAEKVGIAKVVIRTRQYLAALIPWNDMLVLNLMRFSQELRDPSEYKVPGDDFGDLKISKKEIDLAKQLIESMSTEWNPEQYKDEYRSALLAWIRKKAKTGKTDLAEPEAEVEDVEAEVVDVMALLQQSIEGKSARKSTAKPAAKKTSATSAKKKSRAPKKAAKKAAVPKKKVAHAS